MARAGKGTTEIQLTLDRCYALLKRERQPRNFRDLLSAAWKELWPDRELTGATLAALYTNLNLDARFVPQGKGVWGLAEWHPRQSRPSIPATSLLGKSYQNDRYRMPVGTDEPELEEAVSETLVTDDDGPALEEDDWNDPDDDHE